MSRHNNRVNAAAASIFAGKPALALLQRAGDSQVA